MQLRRKLSDDARGPSWPTGDPSFLARFPVLTQFLSLASVDGQPRITGTLTLSVDDGQLKGCLRDRDVDDYCWFSAESVEALLEFAERAVQGDPRADWRANRGPYRSNGKGKRRVGS